MLRAARWEGNARRARRFALGKQRARTYARLMADKHRAYDTVSLPPRTSESSPRASRPSSVRPDPDVEDRLREAFPEIWARYEWLLAARALPRKPRKLS